MSTFTESEVEQAALYYLGFAVKRLGDHACVSWACEF